MKIALPLMSLMLASSASIVWAQQPSDTDQRKLSSAGGVRARLNELVQATQVGAYGQDFLTRENLELLAEGSGAAATDWRREWSAPSSGRSAGACECGAAFPRERPATHHHTSPSLHT